MFLSFKLLVGLLGVFLLMLLSPTEGQLDLSNIGVLQIAGNKQYFVEKAVRVNWHRALQTCAKMNMSLASIESATEQTNLKTLLYSNSALEKQYWLSGNDLSASRNFVWFGNGKTFSYSSWASGPGTSSSQRCVSTNAAFNWRRDSCSNLHYFICEKLVEPPCSFEGECLQKPTIIF
ncbi:lectin subunit alpha-like [Calliphora vicina]|uniref:lectin subunit alpha-like n=1 Tax=Calliphora vicina TaxID=7373 RepID=UPI00325BAFD7